ncbi:class I SAM-dependent methyltransferase [Pseudomonas sp. P66]|uniref:Class I SAM-dependent methyltransferase n=1 Tax=Pseudomonas arcuscaelestis TaxID=2710591 RepID=A0ABS2C6Q0_9PSED|nr:class I SAM-dependent methyltransferase [Pseudomonas arcuscaelestis]MBM5461517.1 class I SAM-dependent methyltransferase [Pseudomonas arcuscaelestis]
MTRIYTKPGEEQPKLNKESVLSFFEERAKKVKVLGPTRAVIYQDKSVGLAERRDVAEKKLLLPLLELTPQSCVLDAGCGTGRWAETIIPECASYVGVDVSPGLVAVAAERFKNAVNAQFSVCAVDSISPQHKGLERTFTHILSFGVFIYLNDDEITKALKGYASVSAPGTRIMLREPIAVKERLTLLEHFSDDMEQQYSAIYRTEAELFSLFELAFSDEHFSLRGEGDVYPDAALNNRTETKQKWFLWEKS